MQEVEDAAVAAHDAMRRWSPAAEAALTALAGRLWGAGALVLDVGVGSGLVARPVLRAGVRLVGVEPEPAMLLALRARLPGLPVLRGALPDLPVRGAAVDGVLVTNVLHHVPAWEAALADLVRVLRPGGALLLNLGDGAADGEVPALHDRYDAELAALLGDRHRVPAEAAGLRSPELVEDALAARGCPVAERVVVEDEAAFGVDEVLAWLVGNPWRHGHDEERAARREAAARARAWAVARWGAGARLRRTRHVLLRVARRAAA